MIYFGENNDYILCECEICKREIYAERDSVAEEDAYSYHLANPLKCACGNIDEYINRSKKSCYNIRQELTALSDLLRKQQGIASRISAINAEINKRFNPPTFWQSLAGDFMFSGKIFLIMLGSLIGIELFLFIITLLMFMGGLILKDPNLCEAGNGLFYHLNIFKDRGGAFLSKFGMSAEFPAMDTELAKEQIIVDYIPYALAGAITIVLYIFLAVFIIKAGIDISRLLFFASKVMNQKIRLNQRREAYERELGELKRESSNLDLKIDEFDILGQDYKNIRAADSILKYFLNNRVDTIREAVNLYHDDDFKNKQLEYSKALYTEAKQTRRYTKAMYMLTSDSSIKVEVREEPAEQPAAPLKIKKQSSPRLDKNSGIVGRIKPPGNSDERENENESEKSGSDANNSNNSNNSVKSDRTDKTDRISKTDKIDKIDKGEKSNKSDISEKSEIKTETFSSIFETKTSEQREDGA